MANKVRLINANALKDRIRQEPTDGMYTAEILEAIDEVPTVDAAPVVHGRWEYYSTTMMECSNCKRHTARHKFEYCPHCGAVMEDHYNDL